jgi:hypothetical protein
MRMIPSSFSRFARSAWRVLILFAAAAVLLSAQGAGAGDGAWQERTQVVWSKATGTLTRKIFRLWDPHPELHLDFLWEPRGGDVAGDPGTAVNGPGTLTWHTKGAADYDRRFTYSVFKGALKNGRPEGEGNLAVRTGMTYTGQWRDGEMHGRGVIRFANGDKYEGDFIAGKMNGVGKYTSTDGSVYLGEFHDGMRHGMGKLTLADGDYRTAWKDGTEVARELIPDSRPPRSEAPVRLAAMSNSVKLTLSTSSGQTIRFDFGDGGEGSPPPTYEAEYSPGLTRVRLASKAVRDAWERDAPIASGLRQKPAHIQSASPAVFLNADVENAATAPAQITGAFLDVFESTPDLTPYLELHHGSTKCCGPPDDYNPVLEFHNLGWGRVSDARMTFSFGSEANRAGNMVVQLGSFDTSKRVSIVEQLKKFGVDVDKLRKGSSGYWIESRGDGSNPNSFFCTDNTIEDQTGQDSGARAQNAQNQGTQNQGTQEQGAQEQNGGEEGAGAAEYERARRQNAACFERIQNSGIFGKLKNQVFAEGSETAGQVAYTEVTGRIEYKWVDHGGKTIDRASSFAMSIPLLQYDSAQAEMGYQEPYEEQVKSVGLTLDRRKYRIQLPKTWNVKIPASGAMQFDLPLSATRSSHHKFQVVLQLANGDEARSSMVDLSYFRPRLKKGPGPD